MSDDAAALETLPQSARDDLDRLARAIERVPIDELPLYADRTSDEAHLKAVEAARLVADETGLAPGIKAAQHSLAEGVIRMFGAAQYRVSIFGMNTALSRGTQEDRMRMLESLGDAVTATILADRLDPDDHAELLGLWARLLS